MAVTLLVPTALRTFTDGKKELEIAATTVGEAVTALADTYPDIKKHLYEDSGELRSFINIFVGETNIKSTGGLGTAVRDGDTVMLVPAIAGGALTVNN
ncbi:MAG: MoaD/ThiS family protein [Oscillospiraceae bacterium]|jgi:molybdopterin converting factor small subunit|nr:MoaD/ThiS family protein [Oscillospiraceae bacterium]